MGKIRKAHKILVGKPEGKRPLVRHRGGWDITTMDLKGKGAN
jgi:hypothetical protein